MNFGNIKNQGGVKRLGKNRPKGDMSIDVE